MRIHLLVQFFDLSSQFEEISVGLSQVIWADFLKFKNDFSVLKLVSK